MRFIEFRNRLVQFECTQSHEHILAVNSGQCKVQKAAIENPVDVELTDYRDKLLDLKIPLM
jgi:RNase P/RNase MRP subunit p30